MLNLNSFMIGTDNFEEMAKFWGEVALKEPEMSDEKMKGWVIGSVFLGVGPHSEVSGSSKEPARIILNIETKDVKEEFERISKIPGAKVIKEPTEMGNGFYISTLADPDGNYFQIVTPWEGPK